jgi:enoyl-CoA hydratase
MQSKGIPMKTTTIHYEQKGQVGIVKLNRPQRMNAVNEAMYDEIQRILNINKQNENIRVLIFTGSVYQKGDIRKPVFCAGADLKEHDSGKRNRAQQREYITRAHQTTRMVYEFPKVTIAAINGPARGAGAELALNCDFVVMAEEATLAFTETGLGTFVGGGVTYHLPLIVGLMKAKELIYTGKIIDGREACRMGIALKSVPLQNLMETVISLAQDLSEKAPISMKMAKIRLQNSKFQDIKKTLEYETEAILSCMKTEDWHEGIRSFIEKKKPVFKGR